MQANLRKKNPADEWKYKYCTATRIPFSLGVLMNAVSASLLCDPPTTCSLNILCYLSTPS